MDEITYKNFDIDKLEICEYKENDIDKIMLKYDGEKFKLKLYSYENSFDYDVDIHNVTMNIKIPFFNTKMIDCILEKIKKHHDKSFFNVYKDSKMVKFGEEMFSFDKAVDDGEINADNTIVSNDCYFQLTKFYRLINNHYYNLNSENNNVKYVINGEMYDAIGEIERILERGRVDLTIEINMNYRDDYDGMPLKNKYLHVQFDIVNISTF